MASRQSSGLYTLSLSKIKQLPFRCLVSLSESDEIITKIELGIATNSSRSAEEISRSSEASASLRQSILKSAFTGQLVPQDPNDEPASELLARIRAEQSRAPKKKLRRKAKA